MNLKNTRILAVCSTVDFKNFTRRATLEAIYDQHPQMDLLLFNGVRSVTKKINPSDKISTYTYYKWLPGNLAENLLGRTERFIRSVSWRNFFSQYDVVFFSDPNQYILLDYIADESMIAYLIRDPNVLQDPRNKKRERSLLDRSDLVLATSKNLAEKYLGKYHEMEHPNIHYWPNCVDLDLWDLDKVVDQKRFASRRKQSPKGQAAGEGDPVDGQKKIIGVAGNFGSRRTDYNLLSEIADAFPDMTFEIAGTLNRDDRPVFWKEFLEKQNVRYLGYIKQEELPEIVCRWSAGLVTDRIDEYASYMHHNKVYQYLSMGVPVISLKIHDDYKMLQPYVSMSKNTNEYITNVKMQVKKSEELSYQKECIKLVSKNSASDRAEKLLQLLKQPNHQTPGVDPVNV